MTTIVKIVPPTDTPEELIEGFNYSSRFARFEQSKLGIHLGDVWWVNGTAVFFVKNSGLIITAPPEGAQVVVLGHRDVLSNTLQNIEILYGEMVCIIRRYRLQRLIFRLQDSCSLETMAPRF